VIGMPGLVDALTKIALKNKVTIAYNARALALISDAGHMLHHDQPAAVASAIEAFLCA
jgi:pimeloyl-ACP methyl ester carboxylesterase